MFDNVVYKSDEEKANLFADKLKATFNETDTLDFDMMHRDKVNEIINNKLYSALPQSWNQIEPYSMPETR